MKDSEANKNYADSPLKVFNKIKLLGEKLTDRRIVEKVLGKDLIP